MHLDEIIAEMKTAHESGPGRGAGTFGRSGDIWRGGPSRCAGLMRSGSATRWCRACRPSPVLRPGFATELTLPEIAQTVIITRTGMKASSMPEFEQLEILGQSRATLAIHLSIRNLDYVRRALEPFYGADCPVVIAYRATWPDELYIRTTLEGMKERGPRPQDHPHGAHTRGQGVRRGQFPRQRPVQCGVFACAEERGKKKKAKAV